jgi:hypothetical protein
MRRSRVSVVVVLSGCLLAACDGTSAGARGELTFEQYAARAVDVICTIQVRCGSLPDEASCVVALDGVDQGKADVQSGKTKFDGVAGAACLDAIEAYDCHVSTAIDEPEACDRTAVGTIADGGSCNSSEQCASGTCTFTPADCDRATTCCAGACAPTRTTVAEGGGCMGASQECDAGLFCDASATPPVCKKRAASGQVCRNALPCLERLRCVRPVGAAEGTCAPYPKHGEPCVGQLPFCDDSHDFCHPATSTCVARLAAGADCSAAPDGCVTYAPCDPTSYRCVKQPALGQACTDEVGCLGGLDCINGTCALGPPRIVCP